MQQSLTVQNRILGPFDKNLLLKMAMTLLGHIHSNEWGSVSAYNKLLLDLGL